MFLLTNKQFRTSPLPLLTVDDSGSLGFFHRSASSGSTTRFDTASFHFTRVRRYFCAAEIGTEADYDETWGNRPVLGAALGTGPK
jgi:hypothetical protein